MSQKRTYTLRCCQHSLMTIRKLDKQEWAGYFAKVSRALGAKNVTIEVTPLGLGHQMEARRLALGGLAYDQKSDVFEVQTEALDHLIHQPREIYADETEHSVTSVEVIDRDGTKQIVILSEPVARG